MPTDSSQSRIRLGAVSFLNTKPLIAGLDRRPDVSLTFAVPSALAALLRAGQVDASLIPVIDLAREGGAWRSVSDACIASDGETMTVRVFSRVPPQQITVLHADPDSHTSVALARVLWSRRYDRRLELRPLPPRERLSECEAVLLIGDKVVTAPLQNCEHQLDLGAAWKALTGLPFVFAVWAAASPDNELAGMLNAARDCGVARAAAIAAEMGPAHGWPVELAVTYLTRRLMFKLTAPAREGLRQFLQLAAEEGLIPPAGRDVVSGDWPPPGNRQALRAGCEEACPPPPRGAVRISEADALAMYRECSIHELGRRAHAMAMALHPEPHRTYVVDRNINYSNWCTAGCIFCNFKADPPGRPARRGLPDGYVLTREEIAAKIGELVAIGGTQILMQGGLAPAETLPFEWYLELLRFVKREFPGVHVHAFSPPEIFWFHQVFAMSIRDVLLRLREAGLDTIPGGGAEILVDRVRDRISRGKTRTDEYLEVMRQAHRIGMRTSITMMFGHIETIPERIEHLRRIRELQDETGGFTAFICWTFQPEGTPLGRFPARPADCADEPDGRHLCLAGAHEYLKTLAIARLFLDNIPNIQASWVTQGPKIGQLALFFGANDMGSVMMEENVVSAAGTTFHLSEAEIRHLIADAGWQPRKRNCYYQLLD